MVRRLVAMEAFSRSYSRIRRVELMDAACRHLENHNFAPVVWLRIAACLIPERIISMFTYVNSLSMISEPTLVITMTDLIPETNLAMGWPHSLLLDRRQCLWR